MTNEEYMQLLQLGTQNDELSQKIALQREQAKYLRQGNMPEMRQAGRTVRAPHWMELIGGLAKENVAAKKMQDIEASQKQMTQNRAAQNEVIMRALLAQQQLKQQPQISGPGMNPASQGSGQGMTPPSNFSY